jgi:Uma2 family endonuclease
LRPWVKSHRLGRILTAQSGLYYTDINCLDPDLLFLRPDQAPRRRGARIQAATLAIEVLSPSNLRAPREKREELFARLGVEEVWYVDHEHQTLEIARAAGGAYRTAARFTGRDTVRSELFPGLEFALTDLWEDLEE